MNDDLTLHGSLLSTGEELDALAVLTVQIECPGATLQQIGERLGVSAAVVRRIINSDAYREYAEGLRREQRAAILTALAGLAPQAIAAIRSLLDNAERHPMATAKALDVWRGLLQDFLSASDGGRGLAAGHRIPPVVNQVVTQVYTGTAPEDASLLTPSAGIVSVSALVEAESRDSAETAGQPSDNRSAGGPGDT